MAFKVGHTLHYFHIDCAFASFRNTRSVTNVITDTNEIDGTESITKEEHLRIKKLVEDANKIRTKPMLRTSAKKVQKSALMRGKSNSREDRIISLHIPSIKVMFTNADQLTSSKMIELKKIIEKEKPLIVAVSEVKPKIYKERSIMDYEIPGYSLHTVNLSTDIGRGIAVYSHNSLDKSTIQIDADISFEEVCLLDIRLRGGDTLLFGCCYRSPTSTEISDQNNAKLNQLLKRISKRSYSHTCIVGDFNFKHINWSSWTTPRSENSVESTFIEAIRDCYFHQHIEQVTRRRGNDDPSLLDLIFTNEAMQVSDILHHSPLGKSDHSVITFTATLITRNLKKHLPMLTVTMWL